MLITAVHRNAPPRPLHVETRSPQPTAPRRSRPRPMEAAIKCHGFVKLLQITICYRGRAGVGEHWPATPRGEQKLCCLCDQNTVFYTDNTACTALYTRHTIHPTLVTSSNKSPYWN